MARAGTASGSLIGSLGAVVRDAERRRRSATPSISSASSIATNLFALVPDNPVTDIIGALSSVAAAIASAPQVGSSGSRRWIQRPLQKELPVGRVTVAYHAVASDFDRSPKGLVSTCDLAGDRIFDSIANDLIVRTESVYSSRDQAVVGERPVRLCGIGVDHTSFWDRPEFTQCLEQWLKCSGDPFRPVPVRARARREPQSPGSAGIAVAEGATTTTSARWSDRRSASLERSAPLIVGHFAVSRSGSGPVPRYPPRRPPVGAPPPRPLAGQIR